MGDRGRSDADGKLASRTREIWLALRRAAKRAAHPIRGLWQKDELFHQRLNTFLALGGILIAIVAVVVTVAVASTGPPAVPVEGTSSRPALAAPVSPPPAASCELDTESVIGLCLLGRSLKDGGQFDTPLTVGPTSVSEVQLYYRNQSSVPQEQVVVRVELPDTLTFASGTTFLHNANGSRAVADGITRGGLIIGGYVPGGDAYLKFAISSRIDAEPDCGNDTWVVRAKVTTDGGSVHASLPVIVEIHCEGAG